MTPEQYLANYEEVKETIRCLKEERKRKAALGDLTLSSVFNEALVNKVRTIFLFGLLTPEDEQRLYKEITVV